MYVHMHTRLAVRCYTVSKSVTYSPHRGSRYCGHQNDFKNAQEGNMHSNASNMNQNP